MSRRILSIIMSLVLCVGLMPLPAFAGGLAEPADTSGFTASDLVVVEPAEQEPALTSQPDLLPQATLQAQFLLASQADTSHVPQNVKVQLTGTETDSNGQKWLVTEVSWEGDSLVSYNELYPLLVNTATGEGWIIPHASGQTIVKKGTESGVPSDREYTEENGRNKIVLKVPILKEGDEQITADENGTRANGLKEGDTGAVLITSIVNNGGQWQETETNKPVEIVYTEENVKNKKTFTDCNHVGYNNTVISYRDGTHDVHCGNCGELLEEKAPCSYKWVNVNNLYTHDIVCKVCGWKKGSAPHLIMTSSDNGFVKKSCMCGMSYTSAIEKYEADKKPAVTQTEWDDSASTSEQYAAKFPSVVKLLDSIGPENASLVGWVNDSTVSRDPDGEQPLTKAEKTGDDGNGSSTYKATGELTWQSGAQPTKDDEVIIAVKYRQGEEVYVSEPVRVKQGEKIVPVPTANEGLVYDGTVKVGVTSTGVGFRVSGEMAINAGSYTATATLRDGWKWSDGTTAPKSIPWSISKAKITGATMEKAALPVNGKVQKPVPTVTGDPVNPSAGDYTLEYTEGYMDENFFSKPVEPSDAGKYWVFAEGQGNFEGIVRADFELCAHETLSYDAYNEYRHRPICEHCGWRSAALEKHKFNKRDFTFWRYSPKYMAYYLEYEDYCPACGCTIKGVIPYLLSSYDWRLDWDDTFEDMVSGKLDRDFPDWRCQDPNYANAPFAFCFQIRPSIRGDWTEIAERNCRMGLLDGRRLATGEGSEIRVFNKDGKMIAKNGHILPQGLQAQALSTQDGGGARASPPIPRSTTRGRSPRTGPASSCAASTSRTSRTATTR